MPPQFHIRDADPARPDAAFLVAAFDTAIPHLGEIGSRVQWGSEPLSATTGFADKMAKVVSDAAAYRRTGEGERVEMLVAEVALPEGEEMPELGLGGGGGVVVPVAAAVAREEWWPEYIKAAGIEGARGVEDFTYLHILISDFRAGRWRKGAGTALVREVKDRARRAGRRVLLVDCWAGNGRKLVSYYESLGFVLVGDFVVERPGKDMGAFEGALLRMEL